MQFEIELILEAQKDERLAEAVRKFPVLYDKSDRCYRERTKKRLAWEVVAKEANLENGELHFFIFYFWKSLFICISDAF